jgi:hypothetical protein
MRNNYNNYNSSLFAALVVASLAIATPGWALCTTNANTGVTVDTTQSDNSNKRVHGGNRGSQTFTVTGSGCFKLDAITFSIRKGTDSGSDVGDLTVEIRNVSSGVPGATILTSQVVPMASVSTAGYADLTVNFATPPDLTGGVQYALVVYTAGGSSGKAYRLGLDDGNPYAGGKYCKSEDSGVTWGTFCDGTFDVRMSICVSACGAGPAACTTCCTLSQGGYGSSNGIGNCTTAGCNSITGGKGFITDLVALGGVNNPFGGDPNATTIGCHPANSVTLDNQSTLIGYLPANTGPGQLTVGTDQHYASAAAIPDPQGTGSEGQGGGTLSGQAMTMGLNLFLSGKTLNSVLIPAGLGLVTFPPAGTLVCTKHADVCKAFSYPNCVAGRTVSETLAAANAFLCAGNTTGQPAPLNTCTGSDVNDALSTMSDQYHECAENIACTDNLGNPVVAPGVFTCPLN